MKRSTKIALENCDNKQMYNRFFSQASAWCIISKKLMRLQMTS